MDMLNNTGYKPGLLISEGWLGKPGEESMNPHITLITLGVDDLDRAVAFYRDGHAWEIAWTPSLMALE